MKLELILILIGFIKKLIEQDKLMVEKTQLADWVVNELEEMKAQNIKILDVTKLTTITDTMIIVSGTSTRHVKALANSLISAAKKSDFKPIGIEGEGQGDWVLVDLGDVIAHIMIPETRDFYQLEKLWSPNSSHLNPDKEQ